MIIKMSKIEIVGPRDLLLSVLETVRQSGVLQIDADLKESIEPGVEAALRPQTLDGRVLAERLFLEDLKLNIDRLLELLPKVPTRESYLSPERAVNAIASLVKKHLDAREEQSRRRGALQGEIGIQDGLRLAGRSLMVLERME